MAEGCGTLDTRLLKDGELEVLLGVGLGGTMLTELSTVDPEM